MKLIKKPSAINQLEFVAENDDELAIVEHLNKYELVPNGASVWVFKREVEGSCLIAQINPFDNTILILDSEAIALAAVFGGKRFIVGNARKQLTDAQAEEAKAIKFTRDRSFPMRVDVEKDQIVDYRMVRFSELQRIFVTDKEKMYTALASLFGRCSGFSPGKQEEYLTGGNLEDKYCRFNSGNMHLFLLDSNDAIVGTISATQYGYIYDEIVDYFTLLTDAEAQVVYAKTAELNAETDEVKKEKLTADIAELVESSRHILMAQLFAAARMTFGIIIDSSIAFIRAAPGQEKAHAALGCSEENTGHYVIHGAPTAQLKMLDAYMKEWAAEQLKALQPKPSTVSLLASKPAEQTAGASVALAVTETQQIRF